MSIQQQIHKYIVDNILFGDGQRLESDTSFQKQGVIDSMGVLDLIAFIESTYGIHIEDDELIPENFDTLGDISRFVERKLGNVPRPEDEIVIQA